MKIYISGRISGLSEKEYTENFNDARRAIYLNIDKKYDIEGVYYDGIINPLEIKPLFGSCKRTKEYYEDGIKKFKKHWTEFYKENWINYMISDILELRKCDTIAMQPNWIESKGAVIEYFYAKFILKLKVIFL